MKAAGKIDRKTGVVLRLGKVTKEMMQSWLTRAHVVLRGAGPNLKLVNPLGSCPGSGK
jgi:hypothetical protein